MGIKVRPRNVWRSICRVYSVHAVLLAQVRPCEALNTALQSAVVGDAPVVDAVRVAVRQGVQQLLEDAAPRGLRQGPVQGNLLEQLAARHELHHDVNLRQVIESIDFDGLLCLGLQR